ncbi:MAG: FIST C-terminal domain-containing protein [Polyangiaceae bacterium]|nr:FIST C-terminal domain-containing protein [Polyangiaceae bacterium]
MPKVELRSARSALADPHEVADDLVEQLGPVVPKLVTLFASRDRDQIALNRAVRARLPDDTRLIGATTAGEIDRDGMHVGTVVLGAMSGDFEVGLGIGKGLSRDAMGAGVQAVGSACRELGIMPADLDPRSNVGLVIDDGYENKKGDGGSALLHVDGQVTNDAALVALFSTGTPWAAVRSHWYEPTGEMVTITKVDDTCRRVLEIDGKPAVKRYQEILGVEPSELDFIKPRGFATRPTALRVGREYFIRSPWTPLDDGSILFANLLEEGMELELMRLGDIGGMTRKFFEEEVPRRVPSPTAALVFHCSGRSVFAESVGKTQELSAAFSAAPPCAGFNVNFEVYCGFQINATLTVLAFGATE